MRADSRGDPPSASCWRGCARSPSAPTRTRTSPSSGWWRSCSREREPEPHAALPGDLRAPERPDGRRSRLPGLAVDPLALGDAGRRSSTSRSPCRRTSDGARRRARVQHRPLRRRRPSSACCGHSRTLLGGGRGEPGRRLSELPLLDRGRAPAAPAEWRGSRAGARAPGGTLPPRALRGPGGAHARTPWPSVAAETGSDLRRARRAAPTGWPAACARRASGPRSLVALLPASARRPGRRPARRAQGRRRLRAARPRLSRGAARLHAGGHRPAVLLIASALAAELAAALPAGRSALCLDGRDRAPGRTASRRPVRGPAGEPRLRDLHLGLDRPPQGGRHRATARWSTSSQAMAARPGSAAGDARARRRPRSAFDISVLELFLPLAAGAAVRAGRRATASADGAGLRQRLERSAITACRRRRRPGACCWSAGWRGLARAARRCAAARRCRARWPTRPARRRRPRCGTSTAPPRPPSGPPAHRVAGAASGAPPSAGRSPTPRSTSLDRRGSRCPSGCPASSASAAPGSPAAISAGRS